AGKLVQEITIWDIFSVNKVKGKYSETWKIIGAIPLPVEGKERMSLIKILVIDDDIGMTELLSLLLAPASSEIITANNGQDGIEFAKTMSPDIIILDLMMPEMNGWSVCQHIRAFSDVPILILSSMDAPG